MFDSDFGRRILMKYGWEEGKGLGRNEEGRSECIQGVRREEKRGLGAESSQTNKAWDNWWADCFNTAAKKMSVSKSAAAAGGDSSSSEEEDAPVDGGRRTSVKNAKVMQGKIRRVLRQERPRESCPASPAAGPRSAPAMSMKRGLGGALDLDDCSPGAKKVRI